MQPSFLQTSPHKLAYLRQHGSRPTVMFCAGFKSDMTGTKAEALAKHCAARQRSFIRFDYSGHGQSDGNFIDGTIGQWKRDTLAVLDNIISGEVIMVGSSMGAWLGLLSALERPNLIKAFIGIASAPDFTERLIWNKLADSHKKEITENKVYYAPSCYGEEPYPITMKLIEEGRGHLLLDKPIPLTCPVHLLHGTKDEDVPIEFAHLLREKIPHAQLHIIEGGDHRLSAPSDLKLLCSIIDTIDK
jgi:pimeloyl-ACP methyl ester carboxylesterase